MHYLISIIIDAAAGFLSMLPFLILLELLARKQIPLLPMRHLIGNGIFCFFLSAILAVTGVPALYEMHPGGNCNLIPFVDITTNTIQYVLNIVLFLPVGLLLPLLHHKFQKPISCLRFGFFFSLAIEMMQLFSFRATDIDDLLMNTLGTALGFMLFLLLKKLFPTATADFSLSDRKQKELPALFEREAHFLLAAAWAGALFFIPLMENMIWGLFI